MTHRKKSLDFVPDPRKLGLVGGEAPVPFWNNFRTITGPVTARVAREQLNFYNKNVRIVS